MKYKLAEMVKRAKPGMRRRAIVLREIVPPATLATDLYRSTYARVVQAWIGALPRIEAEYERTLAALTTDSPADVQAEIDGAAEQVNRLLLLLTPDLQTWALRVERFTRERWRGAVLSATGVDLGTLVGVDDVRATLETHIGWNTALVRDVSDQARQRIGNAVFDGLRNRTPAREVAKTIREAVAMSRRRSTGIAADQLSKLSSALADERRREAGITAFELIHSKKAHPRAGHVERNGNYYSDVPGDVGREINGKTLLAPPEDRPGQLPWCGCRSRSVIDLSD
ncbi:hypothetical protein [Croceibacterium ferulae]|uniref:hypothetical protein n=1 Tax=Croceibacterium ferulae TaxID=1854641 RepID=UPI0019D4C52A|nr:hypothetical protein [Croceibacterium ferulae]